MKARSCAPVTAPSVLVDDQHGADVGVHDEARERAQQEGEVVRRALLAALGVGEGHHAVHVVEGVGGPGEAGGHELGEGARPRGHAEHDHVVARSHAAAPGPPEAGEGAGRVVERARARRGGRPPRRARTR